jgi:putative ABC transport system permease protein
MSTWLNHAVQDFDYGARSLARALGFTAVVVLIIALGVGANTAMFSVVNRALFAPLPFDQPDDLAVLYEKTPMTPRYTVSYLNFLDWRQQNHTFVDMAACRPTDLVVAIDAVSEHVPAAMISADLLSTLGLHAVIGRSFQPDDDQLGAGRVAMLDEGFWRTRFGGTPTAIGRALRLNGKVYTIVGVAPRTLHALGRLTGPAEVYLSLGQWDEPSFRHRQVTTGMVVVGRRRHDVAEALARTDLARVAANLSATYPENRDVGVTVEGLKETLVFRVRGTLLALLGAVGVVWVIVCADVASLMTVRSTARVREFATRAVLGAGLGRLVRQSLAESTLLVMAGGCLGMMLGAAALRWAVGGVPAEIPGLTQAGLDLRVAGFVLALLAVVVVVCGFASVWQTRRVDLHEGLRDGNWGASGGGQGALALFAVIQMSLALVLLIGTGLMIRSVTNLWAANPGFDPQNVITFQVTPPHAAAKPAAIRSWMRTFTAQLGVVPGVEAAAIVLDPLPLSGRGDVVQLQREGQSAVDGARKPSALWYFIGPDYFRVMRIPLQRGRVLTEHDDERAPRVMLIDENLAKTMFGNDDPLGKRLDVDFLGPTEVIGIVGHANHWNPGGDASDVVARQMYFPDTQLADRWIELGVRGGVSVVARTRLDPLTVVESIQSAARIDADQAVYDARSMTQMLDSWLATRQFMMVLLSTFATMALALVCAGTYGVLAYVVSQRTRELGIRVALGASRWRVLQYVLSVSGRLLVWGVGIGVCLAYALTRLIVSLLYGVRPADPLTVAAAVLVLMVVTAAACAVPARRALGIDPVVVLRL